MEKLDADGIPSDDMVAAVLAIGEVIEKEMGGTSGLSIISLFSQIDSD